MSKRPVRSLRTKHQPATGEGARLLSLAAALGMLVAACSDRSARAPGTSPCPPGTGYRMVWSSVGDPQDGAEYGRSVVAAGDVNGDGYGDVLVTAGAFVGYTGKAYLYLGGREGLSTIPAWTSTGDGVGNSQYGFDAAGAGDVNDDGYDDVIVGAYHFPAVEPEVGKAYVYLGEPGGLSASPVWTSMGDAVRYAHYGIGVGSAGDVNDDGYDDIIIGAESYTAASTSAHGKVYLYLGGPGGPQTLPAWTSLGPGETWAEFGGAVAPAGDVNGDGFDDVLIGAPGYKSGPYLNVGRAYVFLGESGGLSTTAAWTGVGEDVYDAEYGAAVSSAGDVNGDGLADFIVGEPGADGTSSKTGKAYLYHGSTGGLSPTPDWTSSGDGVAGAIFGYGAASAGDINADGHDDVIVGSEWFGTWPDRSGKVYVYLGGPGGLSGTPVWTSLGDLNPESWFGGAVAGVGDVDGDGRAEVGVGAAYFDSGGAVTGKAWVYSTCR